MEYRSLPTQSWPSAPRAAGRTVLELRNNVSHPGIHQQVLLRTVLPDRIVGHSFKVKEQLFNLTFCRLIFPVRDVSVAVEIFEYSRTVGDRVVVASRQNGMHMVVLPCQFTRKGSQT